MGDTGSKQSCKGVIQSQNNLTTSEYSDVLDTKRNHMVANTGFKVNDHNMVTYTQCKKGLTYVYLKRKILDDGVSTRPLDI